MQTTITISESYAKQIKEIALVQQKSEDSLIQEVIENWLQKQKTTVQAKPTNPNLKKTFGLWKDDITTNNENMLVTDFIKTMPKVSFNDDPLQIQKTLRVQ